MSTIITSSDFTNYMAGRATDSNVVAAVVAAINSWVETQTHRCWGEAKQVTERYDFNPILYLRHQDVVSVDEVNLGYPGQEQVTIPPGSYWPNALGRLTIYWQALTQYNPSTFNNDYMEITYTHGVEDVPDDLKLAALGIAAGFYNWATNGNKEVVASSVGSYRLEYIGAVRGAGNGTTNPSNNTADANWGVIASYRMQRL